MINTRGEAMITLKLILILVAGLVMILQKTQKSESLLDQIEAGKMK